MKAFVPAYSMVRAQHLKDALSRTADGWMPFAGGTDLMVLFEAGKLPAGRFVSLWGLEALTGIRVRKTEVRLGAMTTYTQIRRHPLLAQEFPLVVEAARLTGAVAIQNRGTLGGNLANASPAADSPPALLAYDAELELVSREGVRRLPYREFHLGYKKTALKPGEILSAIVLPRLLRSHAFYRKVATRSAQAISKVSFAALRVGRKREFRIALGSVAPYPLRAEKTETLLSQGPLRRGQGDEALALLEREISPIDDLRSHRRYRTYVARQLLKEYLERFL